MMERSSTRPNIAPDTPNLFQHGGIIAVVSHIYKISGSPEIWSGCSRFRCVCVHLFSRMRSWVVILYTLAGKVSNGGSRCIWNSNNLPSWQDECNGKAKPHDLPQTYSSLTHGLEGRFGERLTIPPSRCLDTRAGVYITLSMGLSLIYGRLVMRHCQLRKSLYPSI